MNTRTVFERNLDELLQSVVGMGKLVAEAIESSTRALETRDLQIAQQVVDRDQEINEQRFAIEDRALVLIATEQPVAGDLRFLAAILNIITDLERIGDHAAGNARIAIMNGAEPPVKPLIDIPRMSRIAVEMLEDALQTFATRDHVWALHVALRDDDLDHLYDQVYRELLTHMMEDPRKIDCATRLLWCAHNLERMGDRVTNICERVVYLSTGMMSEIQGLAQRKLREAEDLASGRLALREAQV